MTLPDAGQNCRLRPDVRDELEFARRYPTNMLIVGNAAATAMALEGLLADLREAIVTWQAGEVFELPAPSGAVTVILLGVDQLTLAAQTALLQWIEQGLGRTRIISTAAESLWPRVQRGAFNEMLYYRLNVVCLQLPDDE